MNHSTVIYIVRHGETIYNQKGLLQGHLDSPLSSVGIDQMERAADILMNVKCEFIICSDLGRAVQSAQIVAKKSNLPIFSEPRLRERNLGIAQGLTSSEFADKYPLEYEKFNRGDQDYIIPGGESIIQRFTRSINCLQEIAEKYEGKKIIVITHGGVLDGVFRKITGIPLTSKRYFSLLNASVSTIEIFNKEWKLLNWGFTSHLSDVTTTKDWYKGAI